jgi:hypothetical protein
MEKTIIISNKNKFILNILKQLDDRKKKLKDELDAEFGKIQEFVNNNDTNDEDFDKKLHEFLYKNNINII